MLQKLTINYVIIIVIDTGRYFEVKDELFTSKLNNGRKNRNYNYPVIVFNIVGWNSIGYCRKPRKMLVTFIPGRAAGCIGNGSPSPYL